MGVLGQIRQRVGLLVFIIASAIMAFILMDVTSSSQGAGGAAFNAVGMVDGEEIPAPEYESRVQQIISNYQSNGQTVDDKLRYQIRENAWQQHVEEILANKEYDKLGIIVTPEELKQVLLEPHPTIAQAPLFKDESGNFSRAKLDEYVRSFSNGDADAASRRGQWKRFEESVYKDLLRTKYTDLIKKAVYMPEPLVKQDNSNKNKTATIQYLQIPYDDDANVEVSDADLRDYIKRHPNEFKQEEGRNIDYVTFPIAPSARDTASVRDFVTQRVGDFRNTDDEARFLRTSYSEIPYADAYVTPLQIAGSSKVDTLFKLEPGTVLGPYFEKGAYMLAKMVDKKRVADSVEVRVIAKTINAQQSPEAAQSSIDSIMQELNKGKDFEVLASAHSNDKSKESGGNLGFVKQPNQLDPALNNGIFYEHKQGDRFQVITGQAIYIVEILTSNPTQTAAKFAFLSRNIEPAKATRDAIFQKASRFAGSNRTLEAFRKAATDESLTLETANNITQNTYDVPGIGVTSDISTWAFKNEVGAVTERVFEVEETDPTTNIVSSKYIAAVLTGTQDEGTADITNESIRGRVTTLVKREKQAADISSRVGSEKDLNKIASSEGAEVKTASGVTLQDGGDMGREPEVQAGIFGLNSGETSPPLVGDRGVYIVKVTSFVDPAEVADIATARKTVTSPIQNTVDFGPNNAFSALTEASDVVDQRFKTRTY